MSIKFLCPQGHQVVSPDEKAGQSGRCPKCGSKFTVPSSAASVPAGNGLSGNGPSEELIVFLCPNGHKLNGPASLQGRPGQCPHCHARFVIPDYNEADDQSDQYQQQEEDLGGDTHIHSSVEALSDAALAGIEAELKSAAVFDAVSIEAGDKDEGLSIGQHPMAALLQRLWRERRDGAQAEIHLKDGSSFVPDRYSEESLQQDFGAFAVKENDGSYTLNVVAWDAIVRITLKRLKKLPADLFP